MKFVIIGVGQFGRALAIHLSRSGFEVSVIDQKQSIIDEIQDMVVSARAGDASDRAVFKDVDFDDETCFIIAVGENFERSILIAAQLIDMGAKHLYVRSVNELQSKVLKLIGVNDIFRVEDVAAIQLAARFINDGLIRQRRIDDTHSLADVKLPQPWVGKSLMEVELRSRYHLNLLTLRRGTATESSTNDDVLVRKEQPVIGTPDPSAPFQEGDVLVLFGKDADLQRFVENFDL